MPTPLPTSIRIMQHAETLQDIMEQEEHEWTQVDDAIQEHVKLLHEQEEERREEKFTYDPEVFNKSWLEGGMLPISHHRHI